MNGRILKQFKFSPWSRTRLEAFVSNICFHAFQPPASRSPDTRFFHDRDVLGMRKEKLKCVLNCKNWFLFFMSHHCHAILPCCHCKSRTFKLSSFQVVDTLLDWLVSMCGLAIYIRFFSDPKNPKILVLRKGLRVRV
jgi:hypothetical protein